MWPFNLHGSSDFNMNNMPGMNSMGSMGGMGHLGSVPLNMNFNPLMDHSAANADGAAGDQFSPPPLFNPNFPGMVAADYNTMAHDMNQSMGTPFHSSYYKSDDVAAESTRPFSPSQNAKLGLDARAAELKEKLLRSRIQSRAAPASPAAIKTPQMSPGISAIANHDTSKTTSTRMPPQPQPEAKSVAKLESQSQSQSQSHPQAKAPATSRADQDLAVAKQLVPHPTPRQPPQVSISADADDIAALISSISSNTASSREKKAVQSAKPEKLGKSATSGEKKTVVPQTAGKGLPPAPAAEGAIKTSAARAQSPEDEEEEGEVTSPNRANVSSTTGNKTKAQEKPLAPRGPGVANKLKSTKNDVDTGISRPYSKSYPSVPSTYYRESRTRPPLHDNKPMVRLPPRSTPSGPCNGSPANDRLKPARDIRDTKDEPKPADKDKAVVAVPQKVLDDWLRMTDFWNVPRRGQQLDQFLKIEALDADMRRIEAEKEKIRAQLGYKYHASASAPPAAAPSAPTGDAEAKEISAAVRTSPAKPSAATTSAPKRKYEDDDQSLRRQEKFFRTDDHADSRAEEGGYRDGRERERGSRKFEARGGSPRAYASSPRHELYRRPSPSRSREYSPHRHDSWQKPDYRDRGGHEVSKYDSYRGLASRRPSPPRDFRRRDSGLQQIDLGGPGDSRYFIVKSFNEENVIKCMEDGLWTTQKQNGQILTGAFASCKNVILFFSVNKSKAFQGFARMATTPSPDTPRPKWMENIHWDTTPPFRVEWISKTLVQFWRIGHLKNALNEGQAVLVGKDGQEIEEECGRQLVGEMQNVAELFSSRGTGGGGGGGGGGDHGGNGGDASDRPQSYRPRGVGGYGRGGARGRPYVKRESQDRDW